ncbi:hypothetical protein WA158_003956 [Blastocystis sp. Blastoise]
MSDITLPVSDIISKQLYMICQLLLTQSEVSDTVELLDIAIILPDFLRRIKKYSSNIIFLDSSLCTKCKKEFRYICHFNDSQYPICNSPMFIIGELNRFSPYPCLLLWKYLFRFLEQKASSNGGSIRFIRRVIKNDYSHREWGIYTLVQYYLKRNDIVVAIDSLNQHLFSRGHSHQFFLYLKGLLSLTLSQSVHDNRKSIYFADVCRSFYAQPLTLDDACSYDSLPPSLYLHPLLLTSFIYTLYIDNPQIALKVLSLLISKKDNYIPGFPNELSISEDTYTKETLIQLYFSIYIKDKEQISSYIYDIIHCFCHHNPLSPRGYAILLAEVDSDLRGKQLVHILSYLCDRFEYFMDQGFDNEILPPLIHVLQLLLTEPNGEQFIHEEFKRHQWWGYYLYTDYYPSTSLYKQCALYLSKYISPSYYSTLHFKEGQEQQEIILWKQSLKEDNDLFLWDYKYYHAF